MMLLTEARGVAKAAMCLGGPRPTFANKVSLAEVQQRQGLGMVWDSNLNF